MKKDKTRIRAKQPQQPRIPTVVGGVFGTGVKVERLTREWSVEQFANYAHLSPERVRAFERGVEEPNLTELWWIATTFKKRASELVSASVDLVRKTMMTKPRHVAVELQNHGGTVLDVVSTLLKKQRKKRGWSIETLARRADLETECVRAIENGSPDQTRIVELGRLADALGTRVSDLLRLDAPQARRRSTDGSSHKPRYARDGK